VITLNGDVAVTVEAGTNYSDAGSVATDVGDGNLSDAIKVTGEVNTNKPGTYELRYNVKDSAGNAAETVIRKVIVVDTTPPVITLVGEAIVTVEVGSDYEDQGTVAKDSVDGELTSKVKVTGKVDVQKVGEYQLKYNVEDASGNAAKELVRNVLVGDTGRPAISLKGDPEVTIEAGDVYSDQGAAATDVGDGDLSEAIKVSGEVDSNKPGSYELRFDVKDSAGNEAVTVTRAVVVVDTTSPVITLVGEAIVTVEVGSDYEDPGATAKDSIDGDLTSQIKVTGKVDVQKVGEYQLKYNVEDASGNAAKELVRNVLVGDTGRPVISLNGDPEITIEAGDVYNDQSAVATDVGDGDLSGAVQVTGEVDSNKPGNYELKYDVKDSAGNEAVTVTRTVIVVDTTPPVITLVGEAIVTIEVGSNYEDQGATAKDSVDGDLTSQIKVTGEVDVNKVGDYELKYSVPDASGNKSVELTRRVIVEKSIKETIRIEKYNSVPFWFNFKSKKEKSYAIESSTDLREWKEINVIKGTGAIVRFEDERDQVFLQIYFRVRMID
jgi:hypothetical protein